MQRPGGKDTLGGPGNSRWALLRHKCGEGAVADEEAREVDRRSVIKLRTLGSSLKSPQEDIELARAVP